MNIKKVFLSTVAGIASGMSIGKMFSIQKGIREKREMTYSTGGKSFTRGKRAKSQSVRANRRKAKVKR